MSSRFSKRNEKAAKEADVNELLTKYPCPKDFNNRQEYYYKLLLPEVVCNTAFMPSWIFALTRLCILLVEEDSILPVVDVEGLLSKSWVAVETIRSRIAQYANYCGLGQYLVMPAVPSLRESMSKKRTAYTKSVLTAITYATGEKHKTIKKEDVWS